MTLSLLLLVLPIVSAIPHSQTLMSSYPDLIHACPNDNSTKSCVLGLQSGEIEEKEMAVLTNQSNMVYVLEPSHFASSLGCYQYSASFCFGELLGFAKVAHFPINDTYIRSVANGTGWDLGFQQGQNIINGQPASPIPNPPCTVTALFCVPFNKAYEQSYKYYIPYWAGVQAGQKYGDHVVNTCTEKNHPDFGFLKHHSPQYREGFLNGYNDSVAAAGNDNGTYGSKGCK